MIWITLIYNKYIGASLLFEYITLLKDLWLSDKQSVAPINIKKILGRINSDYAGSGQHDAHDLLELLLDRLYIYIYIYYYVTYVLNNILI